MARKNDELLQRLIATFRIEADEHLQAMSSGLLALENAPPEADATAIVETVFREAHSLKGAARAVNLTHVESLCQSLEGVFAALKNGRIGPSSPLLDLLHQVLDALGGLLAAEAGAAPPPGLSVLIRRLGEARDGTLPVSAPAAAAAAEAHIDPPHVDRPAHPLLPAAGLAAGTVRIATRKLDAVMRQVEELLAPRLAARQRARELHEAGAALAGWKKERARIQPVLRLIERAHERAGGAHEPGHDRRALPKLLEYLEAEQFHLKTFEYRLARLERAAGHDQRRLADMTDGLLQDVKDMQLLPFAALLELLPRLVRELAREQGKEVALAIHGGEIEIDRRILEELKDPLIHLLRNAVDHGIEPPEQRTAAGKPPQGAITLAITPQDSGKIEVVVADDGAGIDAERVKTAARRLGALSDEEAERLGESAALALAFRSGVSTSPIITDVSGRGLGLAIVREKIERLSGGIALESHRGAGTAFRLILPLTLATFRGVLVRAGGQLCVIPAVGIERVARVAGQDIRTVENRETVAIDGQAVSLVGLGEVLELPRPRGEEQAAERIPVVVLGAGTARIAFRVDAVLGEQEVLVKPLGPQLARVRNVAGASVLGTGQVVPVLGVPDLLQSAVRHAEAPAASAAAQPEAAAPHSILVVEDSITSRALLKGILESAGYRVATATDGIDAYTALRTAAFDLVVSDVEMPRMDGFGLVARIRADKRLAELPVVLVTALESREHRERGIEVGANAYIVKSSFDQSNLLETIRRLI